MERKQRFNKLGKSQGRSKVIPVDKPPNKKICLFRDEELRGFEITNYKKYLLNTRLITMLGTYRYIVDKKGYRWIPERQWMRHARKWLRRAHYKFIMADGTIIKVV